MSVTKDRRSEIDKILFIFDDILGDSQLKSY